jgi:NAD(P)-dependent dehydrogenase (short-subunit alcohol dehydrogenase family)
MVNAMVQGGSRGLGLAFVRLLLQRHSVGRVFASGRSTHTHPEIQSLVREHPDRLRPITLDALEEEQIARAADIVKQSVSKLHLLINVAGILHGQNQQPEKRLEQASAASLTRSFQLNALAPLLVAKYLFPLLQHDERAVIANISARVGQHH